MDAWSGAIYQDGSPIVDDIHLTDPTGWLSRGVLSPDAHLSFLAVIDPRLVPLRMILGSSLDLWSQSEESVSFFEQTFKSFTPEHDDSNAVTESRTWWSGDLLESKFGILIQVDQQPTSTTSEPRATEILLYGQVIDSPVERSNGKTPLTPSLDAVLQEEHTAAGETSDHSPGKQLRIYALPLSSQIPESRSHAPVRASPELDSIPYDHGKPLGAKLHGLKTEPHGDWRDISPTLPVPQLPESNGPLSPSQKRRRVETLFEDAKERRKQVRKSGGTRVSQAMAERVDAVDESQALLLGRENSISHSRRPSSAGSQQLKQANVSTMSRSSSFSSSRGPKAADESRPPSRRGTITESRRSHLARSASISSLKFVEGTGSNELGVEKKNKDALSRIVLAGMRMYGLQQRRKHQRHQNISNADQRENKSTPEGEADQDDAEEYKLVYHQTFKGACFSFRRHISSILINQEHLRDTVDKILAIFCTDPLEKSSTTDREGLLFGQDGAAEGDPFASTNVNADRMLSSQGTNTPRVRKRFREGDEGTIDYEAEREFLDVPVREKSQGALKG